MCAALAPFPTQAGLHDLQRHLATAEEGKLREIVALVDSLPDRGAADGLIAPLRGRLQKIKPGRRLNTTRLLFQPANGLIVAVTQWRRGTLTLPRQALPCLAKLLRGEMGAEFDAIAHATEGTMSDDHLALLRAGRLLWPRAAAIFAQAPMPPEWPGMTGLGLADFTATVRPLAVLLGEAVCIEELVQIGAGDEDFSRKAMRRCLARAMMTVSTLPERGDAAVAGRCLGMLLAVCLERLPNQQIPLLAAGDLTSRGHDPAPRIAADAAIDASLDQAQARLADPSVAFSMEDVHRLAMLLETLDQPGPAGRPARKPRVTALRRALDSHCRARFEAEISTSLLPGIAGLGTANSASSLAALEEVARDLRRLEAVGRSLGSQAHFDRALSDCARAVPGLATAARPIDLARVVEILQGPEAALAVLEASCRVVNAG